MERMVKWMESMDRDKIMEIMKEREFTFNLETRDGKGNTTAYYFMANPVIYQRNRRNIVMTPSYSCAIYPDTGEFEFTYAVPHSINELKSPKCSPFESDDQFYRISNAFERAVKVLYQAFENE